MLKREKMEEFFQEVTKLLPEDFRTYKQDVEKNLKAALNGAFARLDLVTREEFDIQNELLAKTRAIVSDLSNKVAELERVAKNSP
ncbi:MAG TPA: accessory factor UbiK family protein [Thermoguttaceae bacterium]